MDEFTNPRNLNATRDSWATPIAKAVRIISISSRMDQVSTHVRCPNCKLQIVVGSSNSGDLLDQNGKRHFCRGVDLIEHEERCVTQLQKIIEYYNRRELSSFQLELNIP